MYRGGCILSCCAPPDDTTLTACICPDDDCPGALNKAPGFFFAGGCKNTGKKDGKSMVNEGRIRKAFSELVEYDSESFREKQIGE